jgi:glycosyltransferase involved in cell wall biosynthesis
MNPFIRRSKRFAKLLKRFAYFFLPPALYRPWDYCLPRFFQKNIRRQLVCAVQRRLGNIPKMRGLAAVAENLDDMANTFNKTYWLHERSPAEAKKKAERYRLVLSLASIDRARIYREVARLERMAGDDLLGAVYALRAMRLQGGDHFNDLAWVKTALASGGYVREAQTVDALYGPHPDRRERCRRLLDESFERCRTAPAPCEFAGLDDRRGGVQPRVSVIVSLYNAAAKIPVFIEALRQQTLVSSGQIELILVDSASPADEHAAVRYSLPKAEIPYLFVRTPERESIQTAWNRGIALARAPYLSFLGVDETVLPSAFEELAGELDAHADVDWVMADSLVTSVDAHGNPSEDVMVYDRSGWTQDLVYLETCYLSWVGGLYRKSIHERFGYYDGSFRAAGDTEFKGRVLPQIRTRHVPRVLGVFLNYPEERTTASPRAELEDYRAWYLHRSPAGVAYAFDRRDVRELEAMLPRALNYRKSYCRHMSSDVDYASAILEILRERAPNSPMLALAASTQRLQEAYHSIDALPAMIHGQLVKALKSIDAKVHAIQQQHRATPFVPEANYDVFNDNRYEQHTQLW